MKVIWNTYIYKFCFFLQKESTFLGIYVYSSKGYKKKEEQNPISNYSTNGNAKPTDSVPDLFPRPKGRLLI